MKNYEPNNLNKLTAIFDVIIVGAGISGLYAAINLERDLKVLLLSKKELTLCNSALAQGGIAAVLNQNDDDVEIHINDTLKAGNHQNNLHNLRILVERGTENVEELIRLGVEFDTDESEGGLALCIEGGHTRKRIAHCKDSTGHSIVTALIEKVATLPNVTCLQYAHLLSLEKHDHAFFACVKNEPPDSDDSQISQTTQHVHYYSAPICILATGGIGRVYNFTTNSAIATGDGIAFAHELGAVVTNMNLIQFHPTAFSDKSRESFLISEAVRGEGAKLYNKDKEPFLNRYGESELSPRNVVSCCILKEQERTNSSNFYLDISHLSPDFVKGRFPMIYKGLKQRGYDLSKEPVPIYPCQHYLMGGIEVDEHGLTSVKKLYAIGECAFTGVHGNNRLASNSLLEALVFSRLAAERINELWQPSKTFFAQIPSNQTINPQNLDFRVDNTTISREIQTLPDGLRTEIRELMQESFFVNPNYNASKQNFSRIIEIKEQLTNGNYALTPDFVEAKSLAIIAYLILRDVLKHKEQINSEEII
ncbi:MAG: FAD-binding protein [Oscillospiraceae bacterium]|nr:FAD-binding protein [Oscillospiraceae bacterium]